MRKIIALSTVCILLFAVMSCDKEPNNFPIVSLDKTFGQDGRIIIPNTTEIIFFDFDRYGNIIAVGYTLVGGGRLHLTIAKINADGVLDESFGYNGLVKIADYDSSFPLGMKITRDNKIVIIGSFTEVQFHGNEAKIMRFNENGTVDKTFGNNGRVNLGFNTGHVISWCFGNDDYMLIAKPKSERIEIIVNGVAHYTFPGYSISKYNYLGELNKSFGENGTVFLTKYKYPVTPVRMRILNSGSIIIAGTYHTYHTYPDEELGVMKLLPNGEIDKSFANNGIWRRNILRERNRFSWGDFRGFFNILEKNNGSFLLAGAGVIGGNEFFLSKFTSNGELDTSFGNNGFFGFEGSFFRPFFQFGNHYVTVGRWRHQRGIILINNRGTSARIVYPTEFLFNDMKPHGNNKIVLGGRYEINNTSNFALKRIVFENTAF